MSLMEPAAPNKRLILPCRKRDAYTAGQVSEAFRLTATCSKEKQDLSERPLHVLCNMRTTLHDQGVHCVVAQTIGGLTMTKRRFVISTKTSKSHPRRVQPTDEDKIKVPSGPSGSHLLLTRSTCNGRTSSSPASTAPAVASPAADIVARPQEAHTTRLTKCRHVPLPLLLSSVAPSSPAASPPTPSVCSRTIAPRGERVKERFLRVVRGLFLLSRLVLVCLTLPVVFRSSPWGDGGFVETGIGRLEVEICVGYAQIAGLGIPPSTSASTTTGGCPVCSGLIDTEVTKGTLDSLKRGRRRVNRVVAWCTASASILR